MNAMTKSTLSHTNAQSEGLYELLLEMIGESPAASPEALSPVPAPASRASEPQSAPTNQSAPAAQRAQSTQGSLHYSSASFRGPLSVEQIAARILSEPTVTHLAWRPGMSAWRVWSRFPELVEAVTKALRSEQREERGAQPAVSTAKREAPQAKAQPMIEPKLKAAPSAPQRAVTRPASPAPAAAPTAKSDRAERAPVSRVCEPSSPPPPAIQAERVSLTLDLGLEDQIPFYRGFQNELRDGGLFIETGLKLAIGQAVEVEVTLNPAQTIKVEGLVAWCRDQCSEGELLRCGVGVCITNAGAAWSQLEQQFNAVEAIFYAA